MRSRLISLHPDNYHFLDILQKAICIVTFDDDCPANDAEVNLRIFPIKHSISEGRYRQSNKCLIANILIEV